MKLLSNNLVYKGIHEDKDEEWLIDNFYPREMVTVDCETVSTVDNTILGIGMAITPDDAYYVPLVPVECPMVDRVIDWLGDRRILKVYHNANFDIGALRRLSDINEWLPPDVSNVDDTAMMAQVTGHRVALEAIGNEYLSHDDLFSIQDLLEDARRRERKNKVSMLDVPWLEAARKCLNDVLVTWEAYDFFSERLLYLPQVQDVYLQDIKLWSNLKNMELIGLALDSERVESYFKQLNFKVIDLKERYDLEYGINIGSAQQVAFALATRGFSMPFTKSRKALRSPEEVLLKIDDELARDALEYRKASKLLSTYIKPWRGEERAYTHLRLDLSTGRLASYDRNLQNIPPSVRDVFDPDSGIFTVADMSQVEMRVFAYITQEPAMLEDYANGVDIHGRTMENVIKPYFPDLPKAELRGKAKIFNFAMIYYGEPKTLAERCGIPLDVATKAREDWLALYPRGRAWMDMMFEGRFEYVEDIFGRRMRIPSDDDLRYMTDQEWKFKNLLKHVRRTQVNWPVQASAASLNKRAMNLSFDLGLPTRLQVHDEILWDGDVEVPTEFNYLHPEVYTPWESGKGPKWSKP